MTTTDDILQRNADTALTILLNAQKAARKRESERRGEKKEKKTTTKKDDHLYRQLKITHSEKTVILSKFITMKNWDPDEFYYSIICEFPRENLRGGQIDMLRNISDSAPFNNLASLTFGDSMLHQMGTGGGKSIIFGYLITLFSKLFVSSKVTHEQYARSGMGNLARPQSKCVIICVPTIALAHEVYNKIYTTWMEYSRAAIGLFESGSGEPDLRTLLRLPEFRWYYDAQDKAHDTPLPSTMVKIIAGSTGKCDLFVNARSNRDADGRTTGVGKYLPALAIVTTYEQLLMLLLKSNKKHPAIGERLLRHLIGCVIFDECHYITESDRPAALSILVWLRIYNIYTNFLTATVTESLSSKLEHLGVTMHNYETQRIHPRVSVDFLPYDSETGLVFAAAELGFNAYITALVTGMRSRTAIFIENKLILKITVCILYHYIYITRKGLFPNQGVPLNNGLITTLITFARNDLSIQRDTKQYGLFVDEDITIPYNVALISLWSCGIILVTADISPLMRKQLAFVLSDTRVPLGVIFATSALAEGVNLPHIRFLFILTISYRNNKTLLSTVKVLQILGRHDREDVGGFIGIPPLSVHKNEYEPVPASVFFADIFGAGVEVGSIKNVCDMCEISFPAFDTIAFTARDVKYMHPSCPDEHVDIYLRSIPQLNGFMAIPYYACNRMMTVPGFYIVDDKVIPCLQMRIMKLFRRGSVFNLTVLAAGEIACNILATLPCFSQIAIIMLLFGLRQYPPMKLGMKAKQHIEFLKFAEQREKRLSQSIIFSNLLTSVFTAIHEIAKSQKSLERSVKQNGWTISQYTTVRNLLSVIAVFVTELTITPHNWDGVVTEWMVYSSMFANFFANFDAFLDILVDEPYLPIARAQADLLLNVGNECPSENVNCKRFAGLVLDNVGRFMLSCEAKLCMFCGNYIQNISPCTPPLYDLELDGSRKRTPHFLMENRVLTLLTLSASIIYKAYDLKKDKEDITFAEQRTKFANPRSVSYGKDVHIRFDFAKQEYDMMLYDKALEQVNKEDAEELLKVGGKLSEEEERNRMNTRRERINDIKAQELRKNPEPKTVIRPFTLDIAQRILASPITPLDRLTEFKGMMSSGSS